MQVGDRRRILIKVGDSSSRYSTAFTDLPLLQNVAEGLPLRLNGRSDGLYDSWADHHSVDDALQVVGLCGQVGPALAERTGGARDIDRYRLNAGNISLSAVEFVYVVPELVELARGFGNSVDDEVDYCACRTGAS